MWGCRTTGVSSVSAGNCRIQSTTVGSRVLRRLRGVECLLLSAPTHNAGGRDPTRDWSRGSSKGQRAGRGRTVEGPIRALVVRVRGVPDATTSETDVTRTCLQTDVEEVCGGGVTLGGMDDTNFNVRGRSTGPGENRTRRKRKRISLKMDYCVIC